MKTYTVYHNPRCSKSRMAIEYISSKGDQANVVEYLNQVPTEAELKALLKLLKMDASDLIRKGEQEFKDHFKGKQLTEDEWIRAMVRYPKLIERPIIVFGNKAVVGRPTEKIEELG